MDIGGETPTAEDNIVKSQDTMSFTVFLRGELAAPRAGMEVIWQRWNDVTLTEVSREFAGVISRVDETTDGSELIYAVSCQSYVRWFDRRLVRGFYQQQAVETTIKQIVATYCPGFTCNNVLDTGLIISPQYFNYQRPSNAIKLIADQVGYGWYIDEDRDVHLFRLEDFVSPLSNNILLVDTDYTNYGDLKLSEDAEQVWNRFIIRGFKRRADTPITLYFTGDGNTTQWSLGYRISSAKGDVAVTVGGAPYTVKRDILDGLPNRGGAAGTAYIHFTQHLLRFGTAPANGTQIVVTAYPLIDRTQTNQDDASVDYMKALENTPASDGVYEYAQQNKSLTESTLGAVSSKIQLLALKYGLPKLTGSFTSFTAGWRSGQMFRMSSETRMGGITTDTQWYIYKVSKKWIHPTHSATTKIHYTIEFADTPYLI